MIRFFTRLFGSRTPASKPTRRAFLSVETLETREAPSSGLSPIYHVTPEHATHQVEKRIEKKNTLTVKNLAPGNYTVSHHHAIKGDKVMAHAHATPTTSFTVVAPESAK